MQRTTKTIFFHIISTLVTICISAFVGMLQVLPDNINIARFDSGFYHSIAYEGYYATAETGGGNTGFFPLFPWIWSVLQVDYLGISIFNIILTFLVIGLLTKVLEIREKYLLLYMALPSFVFYYLPLSEATFFFFSCFVLIGMYNKNDYLTAFGLMFASMARPSSVVFIPAILITYLFLYDDTLQNRFKKVIYLTFSSLLGLGIVIWFQWQKTGIWLVYFQTQRTHANRFFSIPSLTYTTWGFKNLWLDTFALWCGSIACIFILISLFIRIRPTLMSKISWIQFIPAHIWFSILFVAGISVLNIIANPKVADGRTTLMAENRYVLANPFFYVAFSYFMEKIKEIPQIWKYILLGSLIIAVIMTCDFHGFPELKGHFMMRTDLPIVIYFVLILLFQYALLFFECSVKYRKEIFTAVYIVNLFLQVYAFQRFLIGQWVG